MAEMPLDTVEVREAFMQGLRGGVTMFACLIEPLRDAGYDYDADFLDMLVAKADLRIEEFAENTLVP